MTASRPSRRAARPQAERSLQLCRPSRRAARLPALAVAALVLLATACRTTLGPAVPLPRSDERPARLLRSLSDTAAQRRALRAVASVSIEGPAGSGSAKQILVVERPARLRVEVLGFLNETVALLATNGRRYELFRAQGRSFTQGPVRPSILWEVAGIDLTPREAVAVLLGAPLPEAGARIAGGSLLPDGSVRVDLAGGQPGSADRRLEFDSAGRLRRVVALAATGGELWEVRYGDYRAVGGTPFAHHIDLRFPPSGAKAEVAFDRVELNPSLPPGLFGLRPPAAKEGGSG